MAWVHDVLRVNRTDGRIGAGTLDMSSSPEDAARQIGAPCRLGAVRVEARAGLAR